MRMCEYCPKVFPSRYKLERHKLIHLGLRPFSCQFCWRAFNQKTSLERHMMTCKARLSVTFTAEAIQNVHISLSKNSKHWHSDENDTP